MPYSGIEILEELFTNGHYLWVSKISTGDGVRGSWYCDLGEVDIIIRMGWLTPNGAQTDCKGERVINKGWRQIQRFLNIV
jgi:hypothetical protein